MTDTGRGAAAAKGLDALHAEARRCIRCGLRLSRTQVVFGEGRVENPRLFIVGQNPGRDEDLTGRPFVGSAGRILDALLAEAGVERGQTYITNTCLCRSPNNRPPTYEETGACSRFLAGQIAIIRPRLVVALGAVAAAALLGGPVIMGAVRGKTFQRELGGHRFSVFVTYHPAVAIYDRGKEEIMRADFRALGREALGRTMGDWGEPPFTNLR